MSTISSHRQRRLTAPARFKTSGYRAGGPAVDTDCQPKPGDTKISLPDGTYMIKRSVPAAVVPGDFRVIGPCKGGQDIVTQKITEIVNNALGAAFRDTGTQLARLLPAAQVALGTGLALAGLLLVVSQTGVGRAAGGVARRGARAVPGLGVLA